MKRIRIYANGVAGSIIGRQKKTGLLHVRLRTRLYPPLQCSMLLREDAMHSRGHKVIQGRA